MCTYVYVKGGGEKGRKGSEVDDVKKKQKRDFVELTKITGNGGGRCNSHMPYTHTHASHV